MQGYFNSLIFFAIVLILVAIRNIDLWKKKEYYWESDFFVICADSKAAEWMIKR